MFSVVTWNVNSIRSRLPHLLAFLQYYSPDVVLLQELKLETQLFPALEIEEMGYRFLAYGQKTYNGVAILSKYPLTLLHKGLDCDQESGQARYVEAKVDCRGKEIIVSSIYVPNGQAVDSEKFIYKMNFFQCLLKRSYHLVTKNEYVILGGDFNVAPDLRDVYDPRLEGSVCFHPDERAAFRRILSTGVIDAWRSVHADTQAYSWWDYRANAFERDQGLRIDHLLTSPEMTDRIRDARIYQDERAREKPSDHAPVSAWFDL